MKKYKLIALLSAGIFFLGSINLVQATSKDGKIHKNIYVNNIDLSHLYKDEAKNKIENYISTKKILTLKYKDKEYKLNTDNIGVKYNIDNVINEAFLIGRDKDFITNTKNKFKLNSGEKKIIKLNYTYDKKKLDNYISSISKEINIKPKDANVELINDKLIYKKELYGLKVNENLLKKLILDNVNKLSVNKINISTEVVKTKYSYENLNKINTVLGTYETKFNPNVENRVNNIKVASNAINNTILNPGEEFSFNKYVNSNYTKKLFKSAPVIVNGKLEQGIGGGICQVSSTLYNAVLYSGLEVTKVRNHSIPSSYIDKGRDATVSHGDLDFRFKNNLKSPILITNKVENDKVITTIYGELKSKKDIDIETEIVESIPNKVIVKNSNKLYKDQKYIEEKGEKGYKVKTYRIYKENNRRELITENYYPPRDKIIVYGSKQREVYNRQEDVI